jgi:DNA-binding XRE family transcriptional regulator
MERDDFYIKLGEKLKKARKKVGMTQKEAAEHVGFENYQTLLSIEKGERPIQTWELLNLAQIYNQDTNYFLSDKWDQSEPEKILWRNKSKSPK